MRPIEEIREKLKDSLQTKEGDDGLMAMFRGQGESGLICCVIFSWGLGWEHVSVSLSEKRCPTWDEMCYIKNLFWKDDETVIQYHPAKSDYVDVHPFVLHLWRPIGIELPKPPKECI